MTEFTPVEGVASRSVYLVTYDEDLWFQFDAERQQYCLDTWVKNATPMGVKHVCLRLVPDPLFPRDAEKDKPYVAVTIEVKRMTELSNYNPNQFGNAGELISYLRALFPLEGVGPQTLEQRMAVRDLCDRYVLLARGAGERRPSIDTVAQAVYRGFAGEGRTFREASPEMQKRSINCAEFLHSQGWLR